jgi:acyl-coenzyme A thioesterase PaaI-like protein
MLLALVTHFQATNPDVVESFLEGQGFGALMNLTTEEVEEAARRVHAAVEESVRHYHGSLDGGSRN